MLMDINDYKERTKIHMLYIMQSTSLKGLITCFLEEHMKD